ncbi:FAD-binding oxidoreductase [Cesiribacter andamanensis]|uniref:6-hydroxy-D-nicotine oxidase n=1 Tax=Cesiribacter andamanensis AMV16 TaxID=1279009 RepID=M7NU05_9BACT|nr:FAD-binding oxidoreductase [Cesiribacter andamanensis]EMR01969.1 6-hydroxy-D-nicotine oxidase [Cesiribacter andamanensis AMV16]
MTKPSPLAYFASTFEGDAILPGQPGYEEGRRVWNNLFDRYPAAIARCASVGQVQAALRAARELKLPVAVRGGGHDYAGHSASEGGLVIDLSTMNSIQIDPDSRTARVEGGARWGEFDAKAQQWGLATPGGTVSTIGVGGLTLGGGTGYLARKWGLTLDNLLSVELVTASGELVTASRTEHEELFWAVRGGSGNFGIATRFDYQLHSVGPQVLTAQYFYPFEEARSVLLQYRSLMAQAPDALQCYAFMLPVPPVAPFPEAYRGKIALALIACYAEVLEEGKKQLKALENFGTPFLGFTQPIAYLALQQAFDAGMPKGLRWYSKAHHLPALSDEVLEILLRFTSSLPGTHSIVYLEPLGGAISRIDPAATAYPHRQAAYALHILPGWSDPGQDAAIIQWARDFYAALAGHATGGVYVNLLGHDEADGPARAYGANYERLARLKQLWDPEHVFQSNHSIQPAGKHS